MRLHEIENAYVRIPAYIVLMPICVLLLVAIFAINGLLYAVAGFFNGLYFGFSDDNRLITKRFWVSCWRGFIGY